MIFVILFLSSKFEVKESFTRQWLVLILMIGAINSGQEIIRSIMKNDSARFKAIKVVSMRSTIARQYLGRRDTIYYKYLMPDSKSFSTAIADKLYEILEKNDAL